MHHQSPSENLAPQHGGFANCDEPSADEGDAVRDAFDFIQVVRGHHDGAAAAAQLCEKLTKAP